MPSKQSVPTRTLVPVDAAARRIGVSTSALYIAIREGRVAAEWVEGRKCLDSIDVERIRSERLASLERAVKALRSA